MNRRVGQWDGRPRQQNAEHSDKLQVQRRHKEEQRQETVDHGSTSGHIDKQHRRARDHEERRHTRRGRQKNTASLGAIGVKEAIAAGITAIVGSQITNPILHTTDGSDFRTVNEYDLHQLLSAVKGGSERLSATALRQMMVDVMATSFDWRESAATNLEQLLTAIAKAATYGVRFHNDMKGLIVTANVAQAAKQLWGSEMAKAQRKIKAKYLYNRVHDAESIINMMIFGASADKQHNRRRQQRQKTTKRLTW